ncbi:MAG: cytochrome c [Chitinophagaceae bacterium]|jgi:mono/diheme cytochrome c family protein|nr:cytochrome c [Chitinophagaceae bacterium]
MKRRYWLIFVLGFSLASCGGGESPKSDNVPKSMLAEDSVSNPNPSYDQNSGEGKFTADNVNIPEKLDVTLAASGKATADAKCTSCHKLTEEKLVGPGWKGVTERRKPEWILNFIINPEPMLDKDTALKAQIEVCMLRMPNQSLTEDEARNIYEYMRQNDGVK